MSSYMFTTTFYIDIVHRTSKQGGDTVKRIVLHKGSDGEGTHIRQQILCHNISNVRQKIEAMF